MCGIVGLIDNVAGSVPLGLLETMRDVMIARGPDGKGHYIEGSVGMAVRRLCIIDPSGGWQPFFSRQGQVVVFQNGEIYNYRELRQQLEPKGHSFSSHSDTEVLGHGYAEWGIDGLLDRIDGMYAIAVLDRDTRHLHLARDRFGEKPLFYTYSEGRFAYSSDLLVLASLPWVSDEIDPRSLDRYLALHYVPGDSTIFRAITRVLPGERLVVPIDNPQPHRHRYYLPQLERERRISDHELSELIETAVESRLVADVPIGVFLSGGLDSSVVAAVAARRQPEIATFSMGFNSPAHDESPHARAVAKAVRSTHHHFVFDDDSFRNLLPKVAAALDEPVGDQAMLPLYWLCQEARKHVTVALSGEGADEVFAGYDYYRGHLQEKSWRDKLKALSGRTGRDQIPLKELIHNARPVTPSGFPLLTDVSGRHRLTGRGYEEADEWEQDLLSWLNGSGDSLRRASATDVATWLVDDLLVKFDRMSMAHSLEGRAPYLSAKIVEMGLALPQSEKMNGKTSKLALRRVARRWLPQEILDRPKQGFVLPMARWLAQWFAGQLSVQGYFLDRPLPGLDTTEMARLTEQDLLLGVRQERLIFALVMLIEWYQSFKSKQYELKVKYSDTAKLAHGVPVAFKVKD